MSRKLKTLISLQAFRHIFYIPSIMLKITNWYSFLMNYVGFKNEAKTYNFRNNIKIKTNENVDVATIAVVFIKKDYGKIKDNSIIIDIGANIGVFSLFAASNAKNTKIYAYEPMSKNYDLLVENINLNKLQKSIIPYKLGVTSSKEKRKLFLSGSSPFHSLYSEKKDDFLEIDCVSLKDIFEDNKISSCDLLKIDCEGAEFEILYGTPEDVFRKIKEIRLEYHQNNQKENYTIAHISKFLTSQGFKATHFRKDTPHSGNAWFERI